MSRLASSQKVFDDQPLRRGNGAADDGSADQTGDRPTSDKAVSDSTDPNRVHAVASTCYSPNPTCHGELGQGGLTPAAGGTW